MTTTLGRRTEHPVGPHDVGGRVADAVVRDEHEHALWERRVDAMMMLLSSRKLMGVDELRRHIEALGSGAYEQMGYYERWVAALAGVMNERGIVSSGELGHRMAEVERRV